MRRFRTALSLVFLLLSATLVSEPEVEKNLPKLPGVLRLHTRSRTAEGKGRPRLAERAVDWNVAETAIIVCDMWDAHYCHSSEQRISVMAPRMNQVLTTARSLGVMIIHAPSGTMDFYADTPFRRRMMQAGLSEPPVPIAPTRDFDPSREGPWPIDDSPWPCDDPVIGPPLELRKREHPAIDILGYDGISDSGVEIYNFLRQERIKNIVVMGVHTNKCVLSRPFGIRQMVELGMNVVLVRDLTDATYDPRKAPYVSHARGTELVVEHIETYWCPSILSEDLTRVLPGSADPSKNRSAK